MPATSEKQRKLFGAALAAKRGAEPISKKIAGIAKATPEKELSKMASKNEGADVGQGFDNQVGDYYAVQRPYDGCEPNKLVHKVDPLQGVQGIGVEPVQIYGAYIEEKTAMTMAEKLHKEFVDAAVMLEKKKDAVVDKIKSAIDELEAQRGECVGMIKENPKESGAHKEKIAHLATKIDDLMTKLEKIEKSKKEIENKEDKKKDLKEAYEVHFSDGIRQRKVFKDPKSALNFAKQLISTNKKLQNVDVFNAGPNFNSTADTDSVIAWWGDGSYMDNKSKKDSKLAAKKIK
jgi:hypothetical protein